MLTSINIMEFYIPILDEFRSFLLNIDNFDIISFISIVVAIFFTIYFTKYPLQVGPFVYQQGFPKPKKLLPDKTCFCVVNIVAVIVYCYFSLVIPCYYSVPFIVFVGIHLFRGLYYAFNRSKHSSEWPINTFIFTLIQKITISILSGVATALYIEEQLFDFWIILEFIIILIAFCVQIKVDFYLTSQRFVGPKGYRPVSGNLFDYIACPNYLCELVIWIFWGLTLELNFGVISIWIWLIPTVYIRAVHHHRWLKRTFKGKLPKNQTPIIPFINVSEVLYTLAGTLEYGF